MAVYSIKELENLSGIKAHTIRIWEKRYKLIEPHRTTTNIRYYTDNELKKILNVAVLNRHGIKISNIARLNDHEMKEEIMRVSVLHPDVENAIDSLIISMIDMDEIKFTTILGKVIAKKGFKTAMLEVVYPFLNRIGVMWQAGEINPVQEHFVTNLIRQKIITAIEGVSSIYRPDAQKFLLFLPEGEWHEIGLLFSSFLIKEAGHQVIYLGQSVPYSDVLAIGATHPFEHILMAGTTCQSDYTFNTYLKDLGGAFPDKQILYFAPYLSESDSVLPNNFHRLACIPDFVKYLQRID